MQRLELCHEDIGECIECHDCNSTRPLSPEHGTILAISSFTTSSPPKPRRWKWTSRRRECLDLFLVGIPRRQIAHRIGAHRNTVNAWCKHTDFIAEARKRIDELTVETRIRRLREMTGFTDPVSTLAHDALTNAEQRTGDPATAT